MNSNIEKNSSKSKGEFPIDGGVSKKLQLFIKGWDLENIEMFHVRSKDPRQ
jgi:hypothetical protein